jgi:hypothetical protein
MLISPLAYDLAQLDRQERLAQAQRYAQLHRFGLHPTSRFVSGRALHWAPRFAFGRAADSAARLAFARALRRLAERLDPELSPAPPSSMAVAVPMPR